MRVPVGDDAVIAGRIDRLEDHPEGGYTVVDVKTGANVPSAGDVEDNPQLAVYQLALSEGRFEADGPGGGGSGDAGVRIVGGEGLATGGGKLVYPRKPVASGASVRTQSVHTPEKLAEWREKVLRVAADMRGPGALATPGDHCKHCGVRLACPAKEGDR